MNRNKVQSALKHYNACLSETVTLKLFRLVKKHKDISAFRKDPAIVRLCSDIQKNILPSEPKKNKCVLKLCRFIHSPKFEKAFSKIKSDRNMRMIIDFILLLRQQNRNVHIDKRKKEISISSAVKSSKKRQVGGGNMMANVLDVIDIIASIVGLIPVVGIPADIVGIIVSLLNLDFVGVFLSILSVTEIPIFSQGSGVVEMIWKIFRIVRRSRKGGKISYSGVPQIRQVRPYQQRPTTYQRTPVYRPPTQIYQQQRPPYYPQTQPSYY